MKPPLIRGGRRAALVLAALAGAAGLAWAALRPAAGQAEPYSRSGMEKFRAGHVTAAVIDLNRALALDPRDERAYIGLAVLYEEVGRADLAIDALRQLERANPEARHLRCRLAEAHLGAEDVKAARELGEIAARREPDCPRAHSVHGIALARFRFWESAQAALERAARLAPKDSGVAATLLDVYLQQAEYDRAIRYIEALLPSYPRSAKLYYKLGWACARLPQTPEVTARAVESLRRAGELDPEWFEPHAELGRLHSSMGRPREAAPAFEKAWAINDAVPGVAFNLARVWGQLRDPRAPEMKRKFQSLLDSQAKLTQLRTNYNTWPDDLENALQLAEIEAKRGLYGPALHRLRKILAADPANRRAVERYVRIDRESRAASPEYLRPGPGISPAVL